MNRSFRTDVYTCVRAIATILDGEIIETEVRKMKKKKKNKSIIIKGD